VGGPLEVAILWHMHQPDYRDRQTGRAVLPWVRLHAVKDYYPMAALVEEFPELRLTFNYVPSLLAQLEDYLAGTLADEHLVLSRVPATDLDAAGQAYLLQGFFMANHDTMILPNPRYAELLEKRGGAADPRALRDAARRFTARDLRDLQVWFNLAWFGPYFLETHPFLLELRRKAAGFTEAEKVSLLELQAEIAGKAVPLLRRLVAEGRVEVSTTPFYHPILPLLVDTDVARVAMPEAELPRTSFRHPEDARHQLRAAIAAHERTFGARPAGIWPSEGSVSGAVIEMLRDERVAWTATDENILFRSLGHALSGRFFRSGGREELLYRPYRLEGSPGGPALFFRDHLLSDLVGFTYSRWRPADAVDDFVRRLRSIADAPGEPPGGRVVSVILDGENAWEYYPDGGLGFLRGLYGRLASDRRLASTTFAGALERRPEAGSLPEVFPGSWINSNFAIWIGHPEDNRAWDLLSEAREALVSAEAEGAADPDRLREAWEELYMAEGSDWCWWYGDDHTSGNDEVFDELYRRHLQSVYRLIGGEPPAELSLPILQRATPAAPRLEAPEVSSLIAPTIDGRVSSYFEWLGAAAYEVHRRGQTMHRSDVPVSVIQYGISLDRLFVRLDFRAGILDPALIGDAVCLETRRPLRTRILIPLAPGAPPATVEELEGGASGPLPAGSVALDEIFEAAIPWEVLRAVPGQVVEFCVSLLKNGNPLATWPMVGTFAVEVPGPDFQHRMWSA